MKQIILRKNKLFVINKDELKPHAKKDEIYNALYAAIYTEFKGASENPDYEKLTNLEKLNKINTYAYEWLKTRGLI